MCRFLARTLSKRAGKSNWMSVTEKEFVIHIINKDNGLGGVWITDEEYPQRVAFGVLNNVPSSSSSSSSCVLSSFPCFVHRPLSAALFFFRWQGGGGE